MSAVVGRVWTWINPRNLYRPLDGEPKCEKPITLEGQEKKSRWSLGGLATWVWGPWRNPSDQKTPTDEFWEAQEEIYRPVEIEELKAERPAAAPLQSPPRWWSRVIPSFRIWPRTADTSGLRQRSKPDMDQQDGELSDYGTPPPSPAPLSKRAAAFRFFARPWSGEILPEHFEICFNFIRHLFDLFVVGFLWTVSPPARFVLDVLGVQGALKLWLHGMAMFLVSSVGMAGLLWLVREYLAQFALAYGIVQALVISVSVRQSVTLGAEDDETEGTGDEPEDVDETEEEWERDRPSSALN